MRRRIAALGSLFQTFEADGFQIARSGGIQQAGSDRLELEDLSKRVRGRFAQERRAGGQQLIEDGAEGIDIALRADSAPLVNRLLGRQITG